MLHIKNDVTISLVNHPFVVIELDPDDEEAAVLSGGPGRPGGWPAPGHTRRICRIALPECHLMLPVKTGKCVVEFGYFSVGDYPQEVAISPI